MLQCVDTHTHAPGVDTHTYCNPKQYEHTHALQHTSAHCNAVHQTAPHCITVVNQQPIHVVFQEVHNTQHTHKICQMAWDRCIGLYIGLSETHCIALHHTVLK